MQKFSLILTLLFLSITFISCSGSSGSGSDPAPQEEEDTGNTSGGSTGDGSGGASLTYDSELSSAERKALDSSKKAMGTLQINGDEIKWFSQIFGGNRSSNVINYFETRVNYALSASTNLEDRMIFSNLQLDQGVIFASNPSTYLWYVSKAAGPDGMKFEINNQLLSVSSTRFGVMQFGAFVSLGTVEQVETLVHEARHSDCTGGALASDIDNFRNGDEIVNYLCGHLHATCPTGPLAGLPACDDHYWGAYAIGAIYAQALSEACTSCTVTERTIADQIYLDSKSRLLYSWSDLINGSFGPPNMSSSNQVR